jgi:ASC-1-like (ASCH) protein
MNLNSPWYEHVVAGRKLYEGRRRTEKTEAIKVGDVITFNHATDNARPPCTRTVVALHTFDTFRDALESLPLEDVLPGVASVDTGVAVYARFVSLPTQIRDGVVMLELH